MLGSLGAPELIIIAVVLVLLFGVGKLSGLGRDLGGSIKEFRRAVKDEDKDAAAKAAREAQAQAPAQPQYVQAQVEQPQVQAPVPQPSSNGQAQQPADKPNVF